MKLDIKGKTYKLPIFMPDATHMSIKGVDTASLNYTLNKGLVVNTYHALSDKSVDIISSAGGIKKFMGYEGLVITDSGGFQAMSLVRRNKENGFIDDTGVTFKLHKSGDIIHLTPESCIQTQIKLGSDIIMVLDDCTDPDETYKEQVISVNRTISWAKRCKEAYDTEFKDKNNKNRPLIFAIIQGGNSQELRERCAKGLLEMDFDGYAYGGWPMQNGKLLSEILKFTADLMPNDKPKYAMGVGKPLDILKCSQMSYNMFDCVIPTRDARHGRLYIKNGLETLNIYNEKYRVDFSSIEENCDCYTCKNYTKAYLRHLFKVGEPVFYKLATIHNLFVYNKTIDLL